MPQIGPYSLHAIEAGRFGLDGGAMFGIVPKPLWSRQIAPDDRNRIPLAMRSLLLRGDDRVILIDVGVGDTFSGTKYESLYAIDHEEGTLVEGLAEKDLTPADVTDVVLTHLHFDHAGGSTRQPDGGTPTPTFPNATYHVQAEHWAWATDANPKEKASFVARTFRPLEAAGQLHLVDGKTTLFPGVSVAQVHGHTEAQQIVTIQDDETTLVYVADLLPTTHHLGPAWTMAYDVRPLVTIEEKQEFLERAADAEWNLFFEHDPEVAVANVTRTDDGFDTTRPRPLAEL